MISLLRRRWRLVLLLAAVPVLGAVPAWAYWTSTQPVPDSTMPLGTLDLTVNDADPHTTFAFPGAGAMYPGTSTAAVLAVRNAGNVPLAYYAQASATDPLGAALRYTVTGGAVTGTAPHQACGGTVIAGPLNLTSSPGPFVADDTTRRLLGVGAVETLCVQAALPPDAAATLQGTTTSITIRFYGKQVGQP